MQNSRASVLTILYRRTDNRCTGKVSFKKEKNSEQRLIIFGVLWYFVLKAYFSKCHFLKFVVTKKSYSMDFYRGGRELLELWQEELEILRIFF